ncbi:MAG: exosortase [Acidobacteria bacterium]|nr:exosortase [Acidobacteriota bacterium]MCW5948710.1 exosortase [Pyrinomonadaceae bacterium]
MSSVELNNGFLIRVAVIAAALAALFHAVAAKLALDWWNDENYSHGLLVPFVIALIVWTAWASILREQRGSTAAGAVLVVLSILILTAGMVAAELFTQRVSILVAATGLLIYFGGLRLVNILAVPLLLFLLAIPIPQILFNRIAFPLQIWASKMAVWGIRVFDVPTVRKGNVIDILPFGATQTISLEVVEACSGIRSLMTLVTLALVLGYFTRGPKAERNIGGMSYPDAWRTLVLMAAAVPIAVLTNAARVTATGVMTFYYGKQATSSTVHDVSGWMVYVAALGSLALVNWALVKLLSAPKEAAGD